MVVLFLSESCWNWRNVADWQAQEILEQEDEQDVAANYTAAAVRQMEQQMVVLHPRECQSTGPCSS